MRPLGWTAFGLVLTALVVGGAANGGANTIALPKLPIPSLPSIPAIPGIGALPIPTLPDLNLPDLELPEIPALPVALPSLPSIPTVPALPKAEAPVAASATQEQKPEYGFTEYILSLPDYRVEQLPKGRAPFVEAINVAKLKTYQKNRVVCRKAESAKKPYDDATLCPKYEWALPVSMLTDSQESARELRQAWQRFEDRYYWRAMTELNNPAFVVAFCWINWSDGPSPERPAVEVFLRSSDVPSALADKMEFKEPDVRLNLDDYIPLPKVKSEDYCDDLELKMLPLMYLPGFCISLFGEKLVCTEDLGLKEEDIESPGMDPIWFNEEEATKRITDSIKHAHGQYLAEYQEDAMQALLPSDKHPLLTMVPWASHLPGEGAFVAPVMDLSVDPSQFVELGNVAQSRLGNSVDGALATAYYLQSVYRLPVLNGLLLNPNSLAYSPSGAWRLEEFKRGLKPSSLPYYERMGYVSMYQAWNELETVVLPEPNLAKPMRMLWYIAVGVDINIDLVAPFIHIGLELAPVPVKPYLLPFAGPRMKWGWVSVPEGYAVPNVKNDPMFDYRQLLRAEKEQP